jgi:CRISPR-associated endonuclease/helicase Cas3
MVRATLAVALETVAWKGKIRMALHLHIQPVYSELHHDLKIGGVQLYTHQVETLEAFRDPDVDVIFNTAMTGDGKSLAAYLPAFQEQRNVIATYPTNELIRDQHQALPKYEQRLNIRLPHNDTMFGAKITQLMREHDAVERLEEVRKLIRHNPILLTNPDLVHLVMSLQYGWGHKRKELPYELGVQFDYLLCDEFHVFAIPQIISVTNMLGYLATLYRHKPADRKKFLFLSATPNALFDRLLERGGLRYRRVKGSYRSSEQDGYRRILQPCELELHEIGQERRTEQWIEEHLDEIHDFFHKYPGSKGAILVNSVATARRLVALLKERLERPYGISIGENTGLTDPEERHISFEKTILVGTSTVDIGVDFRINYLIFEAYSAGSFIQRFGRLGRHAGYDVYCACALVPRFVLERFAQQFGAESQVERETFNKAVYEVFPTEAEFKRYTQRWGVVQAAQVVAELKKLKDENTAFVDALMQRYEQFYGAGDTALPVMSKALKKYWRIEKHLPEILAELVSFRGQSPLSCGVWDSDGHVQTYDLFFLLSNTEFEVIDKQEFMQQVRAKQADEREFEHQLLYIRVCKYIEERQSLVLRVNLDLVQQGIYIHNVMVMEDITVLAPRATWLNEVNRALKRKKLVCIISRMKPAELKAGLHLGMLFQVVRLEDQVGSQYSIAFGQEALLLETELFFRESKGDGAMML